MERVCGLPPSPRLWTKGRVKWEIEPLIILSNEWNEWEYSRWEFSGRAFTRGTFDGLGLSEWEFSMRNFPRTFKHVRLLKNLIREIFLSLWTTTKIMSFCLYCVTHVICFFPYIKKMVLLIFIIMCSIFTICYI